MARVVCDTAVPDLVVSSAGLGNRVKASRGAAVHESTHQESEPVYSPFGASPNLQGCGASIDLPDDVVEMIDAKGGLWEPAPDLIDQFARADPSLVDMSGVDEQGKTRFSAMVTKIPRVQTHPPRP